MTETAEIVAEEKNQPTPDKKIRLSDLTVTQRQMLKAGLQDAMQQSKEFSVLGSDHKVIFYSTCSMMLRPLSLEMLNVSGVDYWKKVSVPDSKKKENVRYMKFTFNYVIPGTTNSIEAVKEWRFEDFK